MGYVEEDEEGQGQDAPFEGESRQAAEHGSRLTRIVEFVVGGDIEPWEALGLQFSSDSTTVGSVRLRVDAKAEPGLRSVGLLDLEPAVDVIDGAPVHAATPAEVSGPQDHPLRAVAFDHVVLTTPDLDRTTVAVTAQLGVPLKRVREAGAVRQGFFRLGEVILEVVQSAQASVGPARWWGLVINVEDVHDACDRLGPDVIGLPKPAVQPGRFIATVRDGAGLGVPLAFMNARTGWRGAPT